MQLSSAIEIKIEPELQSYLPKLTDEEFSQLEQNLLADHERIVLTVWEEKNVILDGHNRYSICQKHNLPFDIRLLSLASLDAAKLWMIKQQFGQRNMNSYQRRYFRGKQYELNKKLHGGQIPGSGNSCHSLKTRQAIAQEHGVSERTIQNDAKFARAIDTIDEAVSYATGLEIIGMNLTDQQVETLAKISEAQPQTASNVLDQIKAKPQDTKRIVQEAHRQLPKPDKTTPKSADNGALFPIVKAEKTIETVALKGGDGFVIRNPDSEPVFNRTNEMVDWASWTWNPVTGCWHGCDYCYAREIANSTRMVDAYPKQFEPAFHVARLKAPANTPFPKTIERPADRNVFTCSMADLFGKWVPDEWIAQVFEQVVLHPQWNFLFLTKFPQRLRSVCDDLLKGFPSNAWMGCTVDGQARVKTAQEAFKGLRATVRWLSVEPMQERLTFGDLSMFDWLVMGGKSASYFNGTAEFQPEWEWVEHLFGQARIAGLKVYFKENLKVKPKEVPWQKP